MPLDVALSRLGVAISAMAALAGLRHWKTSNLSRQYLSLFLTGTALLGALQVGLNTYGTIHPELRVWWGQTPWIGYVWTGFCALAFLGALVEALPDPARNQFRLVQWGVILAWAAWCWANPAVFGSSFTPHLILNLAGLVFGAAAVLFAVRTLNIDVFWLGMAALICQSLDLLGYLALRGSLGLQLHEIRTVWAARNGAWCLTYGFFIYYLASCPSPSRSPSFS